MTRDDIIAMARDAGFVVYEKAKQHQPNCIFHTHHMVDELLERFAVLVDAAERNKIATWMMSKGYATGHGDTVEGLLTELEWQIEEREREACAKVCEDAPEPDGHDLAQRIRARGQK